MNKWMIWGVFPPIFGLTPILVCVAKEEALEKKHYEALAAKLKKTEEDRGAVG